VRTSPGACTATYTFSGAFIGPNRLIGTYAASYSGSQCVGDPQCSNEDCISQTFQVEAYR
jgi:hypothetical protein